MDSAQFKLFMEMLSKIEQQHTAAHAISTNPTNIPNFEIFDKKKESFKNYMERFKNYVSLKNVSDKEFCGKLLLNSIGAETFNVITALAVPNVLGEMAYDDLVRTMEAHLSPKKNVLVAQHQFLCKYQKEQQSIGDFVAELRASASECEFVSPCKCGVSVADLFLRAQFIRGICDNSMREQLLQSKSLNFPDIFANAVAVEAARADAHEIQHASTSQATIHKISNQNKSNYQQTTQKMKIDYSKLGIAGLCLRCGRNNHMVKECRVDREKIKCNACNKKGHSAKVCITTLLKNKANSGSSQHSANQVEEEDGEYDDEYGVYQVVDIYQNKFNKSDRYYTHININGKSVQFEVDSGSGFTFLPRKQFKELKLNTTVFSTDLAFRSYTQTTFVPDGKIIVKAQYKNVNIEDEIYIVPDFCCALLGRSWIRKLKINLNELDEGDQNKNSKTTSTSADICQVRMVDEIIKEFSEIFEEKIGCTPHYKVSLKLRENSTPVYNRERQIPYSLTDRVEKELSVLEAEGIISKTTSSDWGSPLVVIPKADGGVRLCVDYKVGVNQRIIDSHYPIRKTDEIFNSLRDSEHFCRLDLFKAYLHIQVDEHSSIIQTISTHRGTYRMNRLSFGIKTAPAEFNRIINQILQDVPKTESYFDDIIVHGKTLDECVSNLKKCLGQLKKFNLHLNRAKCSFFKNKIEFLGHVIEANKIRMCPSKVAAMVDMPAPKTVDEVRRFLGMVTYYARFVPNISSITSALRQLVKKDSKFKWTSECESAFKNLKNQLISDNVLMPYNPKLPIQLACDASPTGIAGVLSHIINGEERPIAYASRALTSAEQNYSQLDREALAIVFSVQHFYEYVYGRMFKLITDNQPLVRIFQHDAKLPKMTSARLQRYAAFLSGFNYHVIFKKGIENTNADCLSRAPPMTQSSAGNSFNREVHLICNASIYQISNSKINFQTLREETGKDEDLQTILLQLRQANNGRNSPDDFEYVIDGDILFRGQRVVIPKTLQEEVLNELHATHLGITKMKQLARRYVYWKSIDKDIEGMVRSCESCATVRNSPPKADLHPWEEPEGNWQRIHIDYAGPIQGHQLLVVIDAKSKWAEIGVSRVAPSSSSTIEILKEIFSRNGYPNVLVSDNATIFTSEEFKLFCKTCGIFQKFIAPGHPATNGLAERNVQTLKNKINAMSDEISIREKVRQILFKYRATPLKNGKTPSELYLGRQIRIQLDALKPTIFSRTQSTPRSRQLSEGERVQARYYGSNKLSWRAGTVIRKLGNLHYMVKLDDGYVLKRHIDQLLQTSVQPTVPETTEENHNSQNKSHLFIPTSSVPLTSTTHPTLPQTHTPSSIPTPSLTTPPSKSPPASATLPSSTNPLSSIPNPSTSTPPSSSSSILTTTTPPSTTSSVPQIPHPRTARLQKSRNLRPRSSDRLRKPPKYLNDFVVDSE